MAFITFDKAELVNLEYSLSREILRTNRSGSYASTTISGCNTRKYHGLLVCPLEEMGGESHVLLSSLDVTVIQHDKHFNLGIHKYEGDLYIPRGHKYIRDFDAEKSSKQTYRVGGVVLTREITMVHNEEQILIKFTLEDAHSDTILRFQPFLAFRDTHKLSKANLYINRQYTSVPNGIKSKLYEGYPDLFMQFSKNPEFVAVPDWYYNIEYIEEQERGYDFKEDLYVPGYFDLPIKKGESIIFSAATEEVIPGGLKRKYSAEEAIRTPLDNFRNCLVNSAQQFLVKTSKGTQIIAGFPWHSQRGRDTFVALPGITMTIGDIKSAVEVIDTIVKKLKNGLFPGYGKSGYEHYNSSDAPLWFFWVLQQLIKYDDSIDVWKRYKEPLLQILDAFKNGTSYGIKMDSNGLIYGGENGIPVTWMDNLVHGYPVTLRKGFAVEVNALWYNAVCQVLKWAPRDKKIQEQWKDLPGLIKNSFINTFWNDSKGYLADYVDGDYKDFSVRPNQLIATSLEFSPISKDMKKQVLDVVQSELLTSRGIRTLSPKNEAYKGAFEGEQEVRDRARHQGSSYPWLLEHFAVGYLEVHQKSGLKLVKDIYNSFEAVMSECGIGTISELYDGNPPHYGKGAISYAGSVGALLRIEELIEKYQTEK